MITYKKKPYTKKQVENILNPTVKKWFFSRFKAFSLPQLFAVMDIHMRKNILLSAPTGSTKTLSSFLSILNELVDSSQKGILQDKIYAIYISPLKALNEDIKVNLLQPLQEMEKIAGQDLNIRVGVRTGDTTQKEKTQMLKNPPHILITTPESLAILLSSIKFVNHLKAIEWCIIDEIHALAENKRGVHLSLQIERLAQLSPGMTRVGLSATISPLDEIAKFLIGYDTTKEISTKEKEANPNQKGVLRDCEIIDVQFIKDLDLQVFSPSKKFISISHDQMQDELYKLLHKQIQAHTTTLIFTNTRAATERVVDNLKDKYPKYYGVDNIGAHHGSLSKELRFSVESRLREGSIKCVVSSTSLELGIDIGYIDLVILLSSPKSVARCLQRTGRSGHQLHSTTKGRLVVMDRDDLVECAVLLKSAVEKKIDTLHIPRNALDVLAQSIHGIALQEKTHITDLYKLITSSYCYNSLGYDDFIQVVYYLCGNFSSLESRHIYAKIWYDEETGMIGRKGRMGRVIYMTNIGTIPDQSGIQVKIGTQTIGVLDEAFLERLRPGDVFVLGGETYTFKYTRGMVAQVATSVGRPPTVPRWMSEMLPLSYDLANEIGKFRRLMDEKFQKKRSKKDILKFIHDYLYVDKNAAENLYKYFREQYDYIVIPSDKKIVVEHYKGDEREGRGGKYIVFHSLFGRRVNDCLSRAMAYILSRMENRDIEMGINDNGFYIRSEKALNIPKAIKILTTSDLDEVMKLAIDKTEVLKRRFRHCAGRALMILRNYKGKKKNVGRQQVSSGILMNAVKQIDNDFFALKEARREVLEDLMDIENAKKVVQKIKDNLIETPEIHTTVPSPFAFNLVMMGHTDILKMEDRMDFLKRMHEMVLAKISLQKGKKNEPIDEVEHKEMWDEYYES